MPGLSGIHDRLPWATSFGDLASFHLERCLGAYPVDFDNFWAPPEYWDADDIALEMTDHPNVWTGGRKEDFSSVGGFEVAGAGIYDTRAHARMHARTLTRHTHAHTHKTHAHSQNTHARTLTRHTRTHTRTHTHTHNTHTIHTNTHTNTHTNWRLTGGSATTCRSLQPSTRLGRSGPVALCLLLGRGGRGKRGGRRRLLKLLPLVARAVRTWKF